tara:strand:+ start:751 stop:1353 length:603 start_codon:yes stop_codon:yes gene_type:complete
MSSNFAYIKKELGLLGITIKKVDGEYVVNHKGGKEETAYYTNDLSDAVGTGKLMANKKSSETAFAKEDGKDMTPSEVAAVIAIAIIAGYEEMRSGDDYSYKAVMKIKEQLRNLTKRVTNNLARAVIKESFSTMKYGRTESLDDFLAENLSVMPKPNEVDPGRSASIGELFEDLEKQSKGAIQKVLQKLAYYGDDMDESIQ